MKLYKILTLGMVAAMSVSFTACDSDSDDYTFISPEEGVKAYFAGNPTKFDILPEISTIDLKVNRSDASSAASIPVSLTSTKEGVFSCPSAVEFAAGSAESTLTITYDGTKLDFEEPVEFTVNVDPSALSIYAIGSYTASCMIPAPWASAGICYYTDDYVTGFFGVENVTYAVELEAHQLYPGFYRLKNPYGAAYPYNEPGDYDVTQDYYLEIHAEDPEKVWIPTTTYGMDWGYGNFIFGSLAGYYLAKGDEASAEANYGKLVDGIITFPAGSLLIGMSDYNGGGLYSCNESGAFRIVMPGVEMADYSVEVAYAGKYYDTDDNLYIVSEVLSMGADVEEVLLAVCAAGDENATLQQLLAEGSEYSLSAPGQINLPMVADAQSGKYSIVAAVMAGGECQDATSATFKYTSLNGEPVESWSPYYFGNYTYSQCFDGVDEDLVLYGSDDDELRCKIDPWGNGTPFIFEWDNDDLVTVAADQDMEYSHNTYGDFYVSDLSSVCPLAEDGSNWAAIIKANFPDDCTGSEDESGYFDDETFCLNYNVVYYTSKGYIMGWGYETFELTANYGAPKRGITMNRSFTYMPKAEKNGQMKWLEQPRRVASAAKTLKKDLVRVK